MTNVRTGVPPPQAGAQDRDRQPLTRETGLPRVVALGLLLQEAGRPRLDGVSFTVRGGEVLGIVGTAGAGKGAVLQIVAGLLAPTSGTVFVGGRSIGDVTRLAAYAGAGSPVVVVPALRTTGVDALPPEPVLLLDEPTRDLTRPAALHVWRLVRKARSRQQAVVVTLDERQVHDHGCDRLLRLENGLLRPQAL